MTITLADSDEIIALNVRAFSGIDPDQIKVLWVDMKDEEPRYDPDSMPR